MKLLRTSRSPVSGTVNSWKYGKTAGSASRARIPFEIQSWSWAAERVYTLSEAESFGRRSPSTTRTTLCGLEDKYFACAAAEILSYGCVTSLSKGPALAVYRSGWKG